MTTPAARPRVALMAPMKPEVAPLVRMLRLERSTLEGRDVHIGTTAHVDVIAYTTGIGTQPAIDATEHALAHAEVDHVIVVGVAGGMGPSVAVGDLVVPEVVVDRPNGMTEHRPVPLGEVEPRGTIITSDEFGYEPDQTQRFIDDGVVAVDMETGPIGRLCEDAGVPWSAFRAISDRADDDTVDVAMLEMAGADGSGDPKAVARYLLRRPWRIVHLARMAKGSKLATEAAASAAIEGCAHVTPSLNLARGIRTPDLLIRGDDASTRRFWRLSFVEEGVEGTGSVVVSAAMSPDEFTAFYRTHVPSVYGYLLRLCAGDVSQAEDLTQDVWFALVDELRRGRIERADPRWLITVARSRVVDHARRERAGRLKLRLLQPRDGEVGAPEGSEVLERLAQLQPLHRFVLVLRYVEDLPVPEVAAVIGRDLTRHQLAAGPCSSRAAPTRTR